MKTGKTVLLYGASGHAKVIADCLKSRGDNVLAIFDDNPDIKELGGIDVIGAYNSSFHSELTLIISIGANRIRKIIAEKVAHGFHTSAHASAIVSPSAVIGLGSVLMHGAIVQADAAVGKHNIINTGASVDHDCVLEDFVHISPHATLCGNVSVGEGTQIGAGATVIQGIKIGKWCMIGAGAVIIEDVPDYSVVVGVPGKVIKTTGY